MPYARKDTIVLEKGQCYHIYNRGVQKSTIFREEENYIYALRKVKHYILTFQLSPIAYCLMPNHYHFLLRQDGDFPAGLLAQRLFNSYTKAYNKRYGHSGTLFEHRYRSNMITSRQHLLNLCRYIHANSVKNGIVADPGDWPYSNYLDWIGKRGGDLVDQQFVSKHFAPKQKYIEFVSEYIKTRFWDKDTMKYVQLIER